MKQVRFIDRHGECLKKFPAECWPQDKDSAWELFEELLMECEKKEHAVKSKWLVDRATDNKFCLVRKLFPAYDAVWSLELVEVPTSKGIVVDLTNKKPDSDAKTYTYFVALQYSRMVTGVSACSENLNCEVRTNQPIKSIEDIKEIENAITAFVEYPHRKYTVVNFILMDASDMIHLF